MTVSRKTGRLYENKLERLLAQFAPDAVPEVRAELAERFSKASAHRFVDEALCAVSIGDVKDYRFADLYAPKRDEEGTIRVGFCAKHQLLHRYPRKAFIARIEAERDAGIQAIRDLQHGAKLPLQLWDMIYSKHMGLAHLVLDRHGEDLLLARMAYAHAQQVMLRDYYEDLPYAMKVDFYLCGRKKPHDTAEQAAETLASLPKVKENESMVVYQCRVCQGYHLGHDYKNNNYEGANPRDMEAYATYTWYSNSKKAKQYARRQGVNLDCGVEHEDLEAYRFGLPERIFRNA